MMFFKSQGSPVGRQIPTAVVACWQIAWATLKRRFCHLNKPSRAFGGTWHRLIKVARRFWLPDWPYYKTLSHVDVRVLRCVQIEKDKDELVSGWKDFWQNAG